MFTLPVVSHLSNQDLVARLRELTSRSHELTAGILVHLAEVEQRQLYLEAALLRARWGVENNCHHTFDTQFGEDDRTWFQACPQGALVVILLRRLAYTLLSLFRAHTLRAEASRLTPWQDLLRWTRNPLIAASDATIAGLRTRPRRPP